MTVGVWVPEGIPESFRVCIDNVCRHLPEFGCDFFAAKEPADLSKAAVIWDPRAGGGNAPDPSIIGIGRPLVVTLHGVAPLAIPWQYTRGSLASRLRQYAKLVIGNREKRALWAELHEKCSVITTVSHFSKSSIVEHLGLPAATIKVIPNGVDHDLFSPEGEAYAPVSQGRPYFLHISNDEPRKNVEAILSAYQGLPSDRWPLVLKLGGVRRVSIPGVAQVTERLRDEDLAALYRGAGAFVFPSLYEGFGLPIIEAMASGCPVITADGNACAEVAGDAGLLVDPGDRQMLRHAMLTLMTRHGDAGLKQRCLRNAKRYSWKATAEAFAQVFAETGDPGAQRARSAT